MKTIVITGGNSGLGLATASLLAQDKNNQLILACRDQKKARQAVTDLRGTSANPNVHCLPLDLASFASIHAFRENLVQLTDRIDVLACNAGLQIANGSQVTAEGFEKTFGTNHLGHFLLTNLLLPHLNQQAGRIVLVSSGTHFNPPIWQGRIFGIPGADYAGWQDLASPNSLQNHPEKSRGYARYSTSKLCVLYFGYELNRRLREQQSGISVNLYDPGLMPGTDLAREGSSIEQWAWRNILPALRVFDGVYSVRTSAQNLARLLVDASLQVVSGQYYEGPRHKRSSEASYNQRNWKDLWQGSEQLTQEVFAIN